MDNGEKELAKRIADSDELTAAALYAKELEEQLKETRELLMKYDRKQMLLSAALAKSLEFIASLNGVIADVLKR